MKRLNSLRSLTCEQYGEERETYHGKYTGAQNGICNVDDARRNGSGTESGKRSMEVFVLDFDGCELVGQRRRPRHAYPDVYGWFLLGSQTGSVD